MRSMHCSNLTSSSSSSAMEQGWSVPNLSGAASASALMTVSDHIDQIITIVAVRNNRFLGMSRSHPFDRIEPLAWHKAYRSLI